jgi:hypothetical protein
LGPGVTVWVVVGMAAVAAVGWLLLARPILRGAPADG